MGPAAAAVGSFRVVQGQDGAARRQRDHPGRVHVLDRRGLADSLHAAGRAGRSARSHPVPRPRHDVTAASDDRGGACHGPGDYSVRVRATSRDEVGQLAAAYNQMAADLGAADEYRRGLIANVTHELLTPITALHALLENVVGRIAEADDKTKGRGVYQTERPAEIGNALIDLSPLAGGVSAL